MPALSNPRHESFCQNLLIEPSATKAYVASYPYTTYKAAAAGACKLLKSKIVRARVAELKSEIAKRVAEVAVTKALSDLREKEQRVEKLTKLAHKLDNVIKARADLYGKLPGADFKLPGHKEGIVIPVMNGAGKISAQVDVPLIREYRSILQQIREEVGPEKAEWNEEDGLQALAGALNASPLPAHEDIDVPSDTVQ